MPVTKAITACTISSAPRARKKENGFAPGRVLGGDRRALQRKFVSRKAVHVLAGRRRVVSFSRRKYFFLPRHHQFIAVPRNGAAHFAGVEVKRLRPVEVVRQIAWTSDHRDV